MKSKKTYGVSGLMEWQCLIVSGGVKYHFPFTDGAMTAFGVTAAKYTTENPIFQNVIENSEWFKRGRIKLLKTIPLEVEVKAEIEAPAAQPKVVNVPSLEDARQYLIDNCGVNAISLTGKRSIVNAAKEHNILFEGI